MNEELIVGRVAFGPPLDEKSHRARIHLDAIATSVKPPAPDRQRAHFDRLARLEHAMLAAFPQTPFDVTDHFAHGVYGRELRIPADTCLTGKIHKYETLNVLIEGSMILSTENGTKTVHAPAIVVSPPGTKRAAYAITACRWLTIHGTAERDVDEIERMFIAQSPAEFYDHVARLTAPPANEER